MVATTPKNSIPYPNQGDSPNEATAMANLVGQVDRRLVPRFTNTANRTSRVPSPSDGMLGYVQDKHQFEIYRGGAWQFSQFSRTVIKSATTSRTATITPTDDPHLSIPCLAGRTYVVDSGLFYNADSGVDFRCQLGAPAGTTGNVFTYYASVGTASIANTLMDSGGRDISYPGTVFQIGAGAVGTAVTDEGFMRWRAVFATPIDGFITIQWAQVVSSAIATSVNAGSWLSLSVVA